jgi:UDPglucose 6-dehydrogenase
VCVQVIAEAPQTITVIGAGYVGIPTAILLAEAMRPAERERCRVRLVERDALRRRALLEAQELGGDVLGEPGTGEALHRYREVIEIAETEDPQEHGILVCCVGTPSVEVLQGNPRVERVRFAELNHAHVEEVVRLAWDRPSPRPLVIRSTCNPLWIAELVERRPLGAELAVVPEFLREGFALADAREPSRLVIGSTSDSLAFAMRQLLRKPFTDVEVIYTRPEEAALVKLASNALLAERVRFAEGLAALVERSLPRARAEVIAAGISMDPRLGSGHLGAGLGAGGPCLPKDSALWQGLVADGFATTSRWLCRVIEAAVVIRDQSGAKPQVLIYGVGFKPSSPDWRDSPAMELAAQISGHGIPTLLCDPRLSEHELRNAAQVSAPGCLVRSAPCPIVVVCTRPSCFSPATLLDPRGGTLLDPYALLTRAEVIELRAAGHRYLGGGRGTAWPTEL